MTASGHAVSPTAADVSAPFVLAAVTSTVRDLLQDALPADFPGAVVSTHAPDRVPDDGLQSRLNLFLFRVAPDAATGMTLHYLLTAYAAEDDELTGQQLLGRAAGMLQERPVLSGSALPPDSGVRQIRVSAEDLPIEQLFQLWTTFRSPYRLSLAYRAQVVVDGPT